MTDEEYASRMVILEHQQRVHEENLKVSGQWVDTSSEEEEVIIPYDDSYLLLLTDGDAF